MVPSVPGFSPIRKEKAIRYLHLMLEAETITTRSGQTPSVIYRGCRPDKILVS